MLPFIRDKEENKQNIQTTARTLLNKDGATDKMSHDLADSVSGAPFSMTPEFIF